MGSRGSRSRYSIGSEKVGTNIEDQRKASQSFSYLRIPEEIPALKIDRPGNLYLDVLPYIVSSEHHLDRHDDAGIATPDSAWWKLPFWLYRAIGVDFRSVISPRTIGEPCPIQEYQKNLKRAGEDKKIISMLNASLRNVYCVIPRGYRGTDEIPHIWDISQYSFQKLLNQEILEKESYRNFADPDKGFTLKIRLDEEKIEKNYYYVASRIDFEDREVEITDEELDSVPDLGELLVILPYNELEEMLLEAPPEKKRSRSRTEKKKDPDDDKDRGSRRRDPDPDDNKDVDPDDDRDPDPDDNDDRGDRRKNRRYRD